MGVNCQVHAPAALPPTMTRYTLYRKLGGPHYLSGRMQKISPLPGFFLYFLVLCTSSVLVSLSLIVLHFAFLSLLILHNTSIHVSGGIRTSNPSKRSAADPRLRPFSHWDRQGFDPQTVHPVASRYTDGPITATRQSVAYRSVNIYQWHALAYIYIYNLLLSYSAMPAYRKVNSLDITHV